MTMLVGMDGAVSVAEGVVAYPAKDGTLYWTLSFYIPFSRIGADRATTGGGAIKPLRSGFKAEGILDLVDAELAGNRAHEAIDPLFNDIADRTRQGKVADRLIALHEREQVIFHLPDQIEWKTEGRRYRVPIPESDQQRPAEARRFWYLHSNGALSWHIGFAVRYRDALDEEMAGGRVSSLYFLSLLQKLAWPKECGTRGGKPTTADELLNVRLGRPAGAEESRLAFWEQAERWFAQDREIFDRIHPDAVCQSFADLFPAQPSIEVSGLELCDCRSLFFIQDKEFFELIQPRHVSGELVSRRERVLSGAFARYLDHCRAVVAGPDGAHVLDSGFWQALLQDSDEAGRAAAEAGELEPPTARERLLYLFLAGFNQNIIDWANQDASEVLDSLDPIYPSSSEQVEEGFFIRYANPRSLITYVSRSRTLEVGNDHILTCPYAFLIHVLALNNEYLTREKERRAFEVIDWVRATLDRLDDLPELEARRRLAEVEKHINRLRIDSFEHFDRHRYVNPFRYDTERDVFDELEKLRGTSRLELAHKEALSALEEQAKDLERQAERIAGSREQDRDRRLGVLFGLIGLSGIGQLLFNFYDYGTARAAAAKPLDRIDGVLILAESAIIVAILAGLLWVGFLHWSSRKR